MQHEIATAQTDLGAAEGKVLERMMDADALAAELKTAEAKQARDQPAGEAEKRSLAEELADAERQLETATARREAIIRETPAPPVALFHQIARTRKGVALGLATREGLCSVCHVSLRPPVYQKVRQHDSIVQCER